MDCARRLGPASTRALSGTHVPRPHDELLLPGLAEDISWRCDAALAAPDAGRDETEDEDVGSGRRRILRHQSDREVR